MKEIKTRAAYNVVMAQIEEFIRKADNTGGFEHLTPEEVEQFRELSIQAERFEDEVLKIFPFKGRNPLLVRLEEEMDTRRMKQSDLARLLEIPNSKLSEVIRGKAPINISLAKTLHTKLGIDGNLILENV